MNESAQTLISSISFQDAFPLSSTDQTHSSISSIAVDQDSNRVSPPSPFWNEEEEKRADRGESRLLRVWERDWQFLNPSSFQRKSWGNGEYIQGLVSTYITPWQERLMLLIM